MEKTLNDFQIFPNPIIFDFLKFEHYKKYQNIKFFLKANLTILINLFINFLLHLLSLLLSLPFNSSEDKFLLLKLILDLFPYVLIFFGFFFI